MREKDPRVFLYLLILSLWQYRQKAAVFYWTGHYKEKGSKKRHPHIIFMNRLRKGHLQEEMAGKKN